MSVRTVMVLGAVLMHQLHAKDTKKSDNSDLLRYLVALITDVPYCYGTLISPNWVVTAANCFDAAFVQYGNLSIPVNETTSLRKILFVERPRTTKILNPDLGMVYISSVALGAFGQLSAVDYRAMIGNVIMYTDLIASQQDNIKEGVVITCNLDKKSAFSSHVCIAPKCSAKAQVSLPGEPGSPLFHDKKLAGVHIGEDVLHSLENTKQYALHTYTPISPYLSWINEVIRRKEYASYR